jgi:protein Tob/BTG
MTVEIQVALNFLISFLYNKLPRRRVNCFGEELEAALKVKFEGHWYPEKPFKGSAYRCLKTTPPLDPVFEIAAREAGMDLIDIQENLPGELSIWIDPGEVSYRMSEKGPVKILYSEEDRIIDADQPPREVTSTFNPEAQSFKPLELMTCNFNNMSLTASSVKATPQPQMPCLSGMNSHVFPQPMTPSFKTPVTPLSSFGPKPNNNVTLTAGMFAQTKFGSTKLKTSGKRTNQRMSPTEFGNYIKQKSMIQQQSATQLSSMHSRHPFGSNGVSPQNSRSISPDGPDSPLDLGNNYLFMHSTPQTPSPPNSTFSPFGLSSLGSSVSSTHFSSGYDSGLAGLDSLFGSTPSASTQRSFGNQDSQLNRFTSFLDKSSPFVGGSSGSLLGSSPESRVTSINGEEGNLSSGQGSLLSSSAGSSSSSGSTSSSAKNFESLTGVSYPNQYQHLLLAN